MNSSPQPFPEDPDDDIDLLDLFLTLAENIRLLFWGSLLGGCLGFGIAHLLPQKYESSTIVQADAPVAALMTTAVVLDASLQQRGMVKAASAQEAEEARRRLRANVSAQIGRNDKLITLTVIAGSPQEAQGLARSIVDNAFRESRPRDGALKRLQETEAFLRKQAQELGQSSESLQAAILKAAPNVDVSKLVESRSTLSDSMIRINSNILDIQSKMEGLTETAVLQAPTLPVKPVSPRKGLLAVLSAVVSAVALLIFVFMRQSWRTTDRSDQQQQRWQDLKNRYGLRS